MTLILLAILVGGGYLGWVWVPIWFEQGVVRQTVRDFMNQAIKNANDAELRRHMAFKLQNIATVDAFDEAGQPVRRPAVQVDERDITWERTAGEPPSLRVAFEYERQVTYPLLNRIQIKVVQIDITGDLQRADWSTNR